MNKVYVVTIGDYSDYHIVGVFADKDLAQKYVDRYKGGSSYNQPQIEEYELDVAINRKYLYKTYIYQNYQDEPINLTEYIERDSYNESIKFESGKVKGMLGKYAALGYADTPEKSQKIAQDIWAQIKAEEAGI